MAVFRDRVSQTSTSTGSAAIVLDGARQSGLRIFSDVMLDGQITVASVVGRGTGQWLEGEWLYFEADPPYLTLHRRIDSSTGGAVDFVAGIKDVFQSRLFSHGEPRLVADDVAVVPRDALGLDNRLGSLTATLPLLPEVNDRAKFYDPFGTWATNSPVIARNGELINGVADNLLCDIPADFEMIFWGGSIGWKVHANKGANGTDGLDGTDGLPVSPSKTVTFVSNAYAMLSGDLRKTLLVTTGSSADQTITLFDAATAGDGEPVAIRKVDAGTKYCIITDGTTEHGHLMSQNDEVVLRVNGTTWEVKSHRIKPVFREFNSSGTWKKRPLRRRSDVEGSGGGGGAGTGRVGSAACFGGGGGGPGAWNTGMLLEPQVSGDQTVTIGAGGTAGTAVNTNDTDGNSGGAGGDTTLGSLFKAKGGNAGAGGTATTGAGGAAMATSSNVTGVTAGAASSITAKPTATTTSPIAATGGGAGGGITSGGTAFDGGNSGQASAADGTVVGGKTGGTAPGGAGVVGGTILDAQLQHGGSGGSGGAATTSGAAGAGGAGGYPGGGGGGSGAARNGGSSPAAGPGGGGTLRVWEHFH